ncbi:F-box only protein 7 isoform X2 [Micropterus dolomieu]|uniref:F-box only protein 7 isoform X2 n=1 Tax=Micropterus dolomieu TaxID=147949 RepID=UPI001E8CF78E|nr:F-box only protein 7 isoform X2 [Micropterus dolomieu]
MKLRVRINRQTSRVELLGEEPSLTELIDHIKGTVLPSHGLGADAEFRLSLNGSEFLSDTGQTLSSCGIVSGDLICVVLPESAAASSANTTACRTENQRHQQNQQNLQNQRQQQNQQNLQNQRQQQNQQTRQTAATTSSQPSSSPAAPTEAETGEMLDSGPSVSSWEPMLCGEAEEGQAPLSLELLYHSAQTASPSDAIVVAGNLLMLETGFVPQGCELKPGEMPAGWRSAGGVYKLQYTHPLCENSLAMVVGVCMGPVLVINATLKVNETVDTVRKLCLNPSSYVTDAWPGESAAAAFKDLNKLSRTFKDQLAYPLIAAAREAMALPVAFGLAALPPELLLRVVRLLDVVSVVRLSSVCRRFNVATDDSTLWRHLYRRDFRDSDPSRARDTDWKELYRRSFKIRLEMRRESCRHFLPPFHRTPRDIFNPVPVPLHPPLPGIIGGEYDQRPNLPHGLLPRPRFDPIGPLHDPDGRLMGNFRRVGPMRGRPADVRRGFI